MIRPCNIIFFDRLKSGLYSLVLQATFCLILLSGPSLAANWSETTPPVNLEHIFNGSINKKGKPVGFHLRPLGNDPATARLIKLKSAANAIGVYTGEVEIFDKKSGTWKRKNFSSFFPDRLTQGEALNLILKAYSDAKIDDRGKWRGRSGLGFTIEGWLCPKGGRVDCPDGAINTAYPIYKKD